MHDSTAKAIGFDELRVRFRSQRRALVREIVLKKASGQKALTIIAEEAAKLIKVDQDAFIEDALEDLKEMDSSRLAVFGITQSEFAAWEEAKKK